MDFLGLFSLLICWYIQTNRLSSSWKPDFYFGTNLNLSVFKPFRKNYKIDKETRNPMRNLSILELTA